MGMAFSRQGNQSTTMHYKKRWDYDAKKRQAPYTQWAGASCSDAVPGKASQSQGKMKTCGL